MSLIDRAEARRESALAAMDPSERAAVGQYFTRHQTVADLASETEAWCASSPTQVIHLNGEALPAASERLVIAGEAGE